MELVSKRKDDNRLTAITEQYLEDVFYTRTDNFERVTDRERQIQGIDTLFEIKGEKFICDEKSAVRYRHLKTFSFELSFINRRGELMEGWLTNPNLKTDSYLLFWIDSSKADTPTENVLNETADILTAQVALVRKKDLLNYLASLGWTKERLKQKAENIRNNPDDEVMGNVYKDGCKFTFSRQLAEQPINVLITRQKLGELSCANMSIKQLSE